MAVPEVATTEQGRGDIISSPFGVTSRQAGGDLSLTCLVSGLDLARRDSVWLDFDARAGCCSSRRARPQERFGLVFKGDPLGSARRGFADLENRQRRKSFVSSNRTPSAFWNRLFTVAE